MSNEPPAACQNCGESYDNVYADCPNCGTGFFMPPVGDRAACDNCGEPFDRDRYECPDCGSEVVPPS